MDWKQDIIVRYVSELRSPPLLYVPVYVPVKAISAQNHGGIAEH